MTSRLVLTRKDPRRTDFVLVDDAEHRSPLYTSCTTRNGSRVRTTITRTDPTGDRFQVGVIEWPVHPSHGAQLVVGTRDVKMANSGVYTSPERFTAADGYVYEWQMRGARPQLVPIRQYSHAADAYVATFIQSQSSWFFWRRKTSSLFVPPEGFHILDDIIVTFVYFEGKWLGKEGAKAHSGLSEAKSEAFL